MIRRMTFLLVTATLGLSALPAHAFFEAITASPRSRAMGEAGVAVPDAAYATHLNPAFLGGATGGAASASYLQPFSLGFTDFYAAGVALPVSPRFGAVSLGITQFKVAYEDVSLDKETRISLGHGFRLYEDYHSRVDVGWSLNLHNVELGETVTGLDPGQDTAFGFDLGLAMTLHKRTRLGVLVRNVNNPKIGVDEEELPPRLVAGIGYAPFEGIITTFQFDNEIDADTSYRGGVEAVIVEGFALRAGVLTNPNRLTAGFGYSLRGFALNYGFSTGGGTLESSHQFGLNYAWGGEAQ